MCECPICSSKLIEKEFSPCQDCGEFAREVNKISNKIPLYHEYEVFAGLNLILCESCDINFYSRSSIPFGLKKPFSTKDLKMNVIRDIIDTNKEIDQYCPECNHRLKFLIFLKFSREKFSGKE